MVTTGVSRITEEILGKTFLGSRVWSLEYGSDHGLDGARVFRTPS